MKKLLLVLCLISAFTLTACNKHENNTDIINNSHIETINVSIDKNNSSELDNQIDTLINELDNIDQKSTTNDTLIEENSSEEAPAMKMRVIDNQSEEEE